jgi:hypothetical protein
VYWYYGAICSEISVIGCLWQPRKHKLHNGEWAYVGRSLEISPPFGRKTSVILLSGEEVSWRVENGPHDSSV